MEMLSSEYGWTPEQIRQQRLDEIDQYIAIINVKRKLKAQQAKKYGGRS